MPLAQGGSLREVGPLPEESAYLLLGGHFRSCRLCLMKGGYHSKKSLPFEEEFVVRRSGS